MKEVILISGTPGTGKTELAKKIAERYDYEYIHIGEHEEYIIAEKDVKIIDLNKLIKWLKKKQDSNEKDMIVDSHLSHYYPPDRTKICIIMRCDPAELRMRLKRRQYPEQKININLEAEAMDLILQEALAEGHKVHEIDTTHKTASICEEEAINVIDGGERSYGKIDYSHYLVKK